MFGRRLSRRTVVRGAGYAAAGSWLSALLGACGAAPAAPTAEPKVVERVVTQVVEKVVEKPVERVVTQVVEKPVERQVIVTATAAPAGARAVEIKFATDFNAGIRLDELNLFKDRFMAKNPNVKVTHWHMGGGGTTGPGGYNDILVAQLLTGTAAEVMQTWGTMVVERPEMLADVGDELKKYGFKPDDYIWDADRNAHYDKQGRLKSLPFNRTSTGWLYNKTMFDKAGMKPPTEEWTWNDMLAAAKALTKPQEKEWGVVANTSAWDGGYWELIWAETGRLRDGKRTALSDGSGPDAFQFYVDLIYKDKVSPDPAVTRAMLTAELTHPFASGKVAMIGYPIHGTSGLAPLIQDRFEWAIMPTPKSNSTGRRGFNASIEPVSIAEESKKRGTFEVAVQYYMSWLDDEMQVWMAKNRPHLPMKKAALNTPDHLSAPPFNREQLVKNILDKTEHQMNYAYFKGWGEWQLAVHREVSKAYTGEVPPKQALAAGCKAGDTVLANAEL
jgi:multiple sugar transport system substrate-binding protein